MAQAVSSSICNLDNLYQGKVGYNYSLPREILEKYKAGRGFPDSVGYDASTQQKIVDDTDALYQKMMAQNPVKEKVAVITAGSPGAGKTWLMRKDLACQEKQHAYIDPDDVVLRQYMETTYQKKLSEGLALIDSTPYPSQREKLEAIKKLRQELYNEFRDGSNFTTQVTLADLVRNGVSFYYGTTSSSPATAYFYKFLKDQGYTIRVLHISASDDVRWGSIQERDKTFVQTTEKDIKEKAYMVPERIDDTYLKYADIIEFFYLGEVHEDAVKAATWTRKKGEDIGTLKIHNKTAYEATKKMQDLLSRGKESILWKNTVEKKSEIID